MKILNRLTACVLLALSGQAVCAATDASGNYLRVEPFYIEPGCTLTVNLNMVNNTEICAYQADIELPEGLSVTSQSFGAVKIYGIANAQSRIYPSLPPTISSEMVDDVFRVVCYHPQNVPFIGNEGAVATITVCADKSLKAGVYDVKVKNAELATPASVPYNPDPEVTSATVGEKDSESLTLAGDFDEEAANTLNNALASDPELCVIDMTGVTSFPNILLDAANPNALIYLPSSDKVAVANAVNVVRDGVCDRIELTDGYPFAVGDEFTISTGEYSRTLKGGDYGTVVLPFAIDETTRDMYLFYSYSYRNGTDMTFTLVDNPLPGVPYLYVCKDETTDCQGFTALPSSSVDGYIDNGTTIGEWQPKGTFRKIEIADADVLDCTYYISGGKMRNATKSLTINPFRAYFAGPSYSATFGSGEVKSFRIVLSDEVSGIDSVITEKKSGRYYDLNGNVVPSPDRSGVYVRDGKKYYIKK